ncbi:MAG TPA: hypothetical protein VIZ21_09600 [Ignavibacteriaceae bacterium]
MVKLLSNSKIFALILLSASIVFLGCEKKTEQSQQPKDGIQTEQTAPDTVSEIKEPVVEEKIIIPDIKGTWTGTFDGKPTTLNITEQADSSFSGKITINYKQTLNQDVKGNFSPSTLKMSMVDQLHSKFMGKYIGNLSEDFKKFSGTFTKNRDNSTYSFNLNKK